jgi:hypothetical protein
MTNLTQMWAALARYQPYADKDGHGESWRVMCSERTTEAAAAAAVEAAAAASAAAWAAASAAWEAAAWAAKAGADVAYWSDLAVKRIEDAIKERNHD